MPTIEVDFEIFKALTAMRRSEEMSCGDAIRELLGLPISAGKPTPIPLAAPEWVTKGVHFPEGTEFRAVYKGQTHLGEVRSGTLMVSGQRASSPSKAAELVTGTNVNGWLFWEVKLPGTGRWKPINAMRKGS